MNTDFLGPQILALPVLLFAIVIHEFAHAYTAFLAGDDTAAAQGRLTLNPISHVDPFGTILVPLMLYLSNTGFMIGWARPVPVNPLRFRSSEWDIFVSLAGPGSNFVLAAIAAILLKIAMVAGLFDVGDVEAAVAVMVLRYGKPQPLALLLLYFITINIVLGLFNLIPIPPLDGSHVLYRLLASSGSTLADRYAALQPYGFFILILILISPVGKVFSWIVAVCISFVLKFVL